MEVRLEVWQEGFDSFERSYVNFLEAAKRDILESEALIQEGFIQRFEYNLEVARKLFREYLKENNTNFDFFKTRSEEVILKIYEEKIINDYSVWFEAIEWRNFTSHEYCQPSDKKEVIRFAKECFWPELRYSYLKLKARLDS